MHQNEVTRTQSNAYTIAVHVGSERQPLRVLIDSGSADFWVASSRCANCCVDTTSVGCDTKAFDTVHAACLLPSLPSVGKFLAFGR